MVALRRMPSARVLRKLIDCNPETGELRWKERPVWMFKNGGLGRVAYARLWNEKYAGQPAFTAIDKTGYRVGGMFGGCHSAHRIIWRWRTGLIPNSIDHINGDRSDNRISNLRSVSHSENMRNASMTIRNKSGVIGVCWDRRQHKWKACIQHAKRSVYLGHFEALEAAAAARKIAEQKYGYHPNHGRIG